MRDVYIVGAGMTPFGKHLDKSVKDLTAASVLGALHDGGIAKEELEGVWFANSTWGFFTEQNFVRGQVAMKGLGIHGIPVINVENACGGGATALHSAWLSVASGLHECALAVGTEKLWHEDKTVSFRALLGGTDMETIDDFLAAWKNVCPVPPDEAPPEVFAAACESSPIFTMDLYAYMARAHMRRYGTTQRQIATIASKNHYHGSLNPLAMYRADMSVDEILAGRLLSWPVTVPMCAPVSDGSAAAVVCSGEFLERLRRRAAAPRPVKVLASVMGSHSPRPLSDVENDTARIVSLKAYEKANLGPGDIDLAEVHDASAFGELRVTEALGFCEPGGGGPLAESGATRLGGRLPVNVSGGLASRGHPLAATGLAQVYELVTQLRGEAGARQVEGARIAIAENGGGFVYFEEASMHIHILESVSP